MSALSEDFQKRVSVVAEMIGPLMKDVSIIKNNVELIKGSLIAHLRMSVKVIL
jgi:hypothetical protein